MKRVLMSDELFEHLGASRVEWGEPDADGFYTPTVYAEPREDALRQAIRAAAAGCHHERWDSDWQDGHTTLEWTDCTAWPCAALQGATDDQ